MHSTPSSSNPDSPAERFYGTALERIRRFLLILGAMGLLVCVVRFGTVVAAGFLVGGSISYINHRWLERVVGALGERITTGQSSERGGGIVVRALLRYLLIAAGAYVIFRISQAALYGFLGGICLTIAAIACEAAVEIYVGLQRGL
jgi:hypothetical protein